MTEDDLLQALAKAKAPTAKDDAGLTVHELAEKLYGRNSLGNRTRVTARLLQLKKEGKLLIGKRYAERLNGAMYPLSVYAVVKK